MSNSSIWPIDKTLSGTTTLIKSGPGSNGNEGILRISQSSSITGTLPLDCLLSYPGHKLRESYPLAETQSVYSTDSGDWAIYNCVQIISIRLGYLIENIKLLENDY